MIPKVKALTIHEKRAITASVFHPAGVAVPTKRPGNYGMSPRGVTRYIRRESRIDQPALLSVAMFRSQLRSGTIENLLVGFAAARRHFDRPFWRNYFGRAEMRTLRAATGAKRPTRAASLALSRSTSAQRKLQQVSSTILRTANL